MQATSVSYISSHVDLAGDGGGDEGGAAFLEKLDGSFGLGDEAASTSPTASSTKQLHDSRLVLSLVAWNVQVFDNENVMVGKSPVTAQSFQRH